MNRSKWLNSCSCVLKEVLRAEQTERNGYAIRCKPGGFAILFTLLAAISSSSRGASDVKYTVEGRIAYTAPGIATNNNNFRIEVSNCNWTITIDPGYKERTIYKQSFDGHAVSCVARFDAYNGSASNHLRNDSVAILTDGPVPDATFGTLGVSQVWLAYASHCYLASRTNTLLDMLWFTDKKLREQNYKTPARWVLATNAPYLPSTVDYFCSIESFRLAIGKHLPSHLKTNDIRLWSTYRAYAFTNIPNFAIPGSFTYTQFEPLSKNEEPVEVYVYAGTVTNAFTGLAEDELSRVFGNRTLVRDDRLIHTTNRIAAVRYLVEDGLIPATTDPKVQKAVKAAQATTLQAQSAISFRKAFSWRHVVVLVSLVGISFPFVCLLKRKG